MREETLRMSGKERDRLIVMERVESEGMILREAAEELELSYRQTRRIWSRYRQKGAEGLLHQSRGRASNRCRPSEEKEKILSEYREKYGDFGPTLASEKLTESGLEVSRETLRRWLLGAGLWPGRTKARQHRRRRPRRAHFGGMAQLDGSPHAWFEDRGETCCLLVMVDDATGHTLARFAPAEATRSVLELLRLWVERHGVPREIYTDRHTIYVVDRDATEEEKRAGTGPLTDFGRVCRRLGMRHIKAHSPQAKGRVERKNGVLQDRLVKELRLLGVSTIEGGNAMLDSFLEKQNKQFARKPEAPLDQHGKKPGKEILDDVFCREETRSVANDWTFSFRGRRYQLPRQDGLPKPRQKVTVRIRWDDSMAVLHKDRLLRHQLAADAPSHDETTFKKLAQSEQTITQWLPSKPRGKTPRPRGARQTAPPAPSSTPGSKPPPGAPKKPQTRGRGGSKTPSPP